MPCAICPFKKVVTLSSSQGHRPMILDPNNEEAFLGDATLSKVTITTEEDMRHFRGLGPNPDWSFTSKSGNVYRYDDGSLEKAKQEYSAPVEDYCECCGHDVGGKERTLTRYVDPESGEMIFPGHTVRHMDIHVGTTVKGSAELAFEEFSKIRDAVLNGSLLFLKSSIGEGYVQVIYCREEAAADLGTVCLEWVALKPLESPQE